MGGRKILVTVSEEQHKALERLADEQGLRVSTFAKAELLKIMRSAFPADKDKRTIAVEVTNARELAGYVEQKHFGTIASFATFAMECVMQRNPLTAAQKARVGKNID